MPECELRIRFILWKGGDLCKKNMKIRLILAVIAVALVWIMYSPLSVEAKPKSHLSTKAKTLSVGQEYTVKMKSISTKDKKKERKVKWKVSDKSVVLIKGKKTFFGEVGQILYIKRN